MIDTPSYGWTNVHIKDSFINGISYICEPHLLLCEAFTRYLNGSIFDAGIAQFDLEGDYAVVLLSACGVTVIHNGDSVTYEVPEREIIGMADELASDIEKDFDLWIEWNCPCDDEERNAEISAISEYLVDLKCAIQHAKSVHQAADIHMVDCR